MSKLLRIIFPALLLLFAACTHNDGDIGPLFGQWRLTSPECPDAALYISFQNTTVETKAVYPRHESTEAFGNWTLSDRILTLDFPDPDRQAPAEFQFGAFEQFTVETLTSRRFVLTTPDRRLEFEKW